MYEGLSANLAIAAVTVGIFSFWAARRIIPTKLAAFVVAIKILIPFVYFSLFFDGKWTTYDENGYLSGAIRLKSMGYGPLTVLIRPDGLLQLGVVAAGPHILYNWWNLLAITLFGPEHYAAVFLNVGLSFVAGTYLYKTALLAGFDRRYAQGLFVFFLLHWDILAWTSFPNLKDIFLVTFIIAFLYHVARLVSKIEPKPNRLVEFACVSGYVFLMTLIRLYLPVLLLVAVMIWNLLRQRGATRIVMLVISAVAGGVLFTHIPSEKGSGHVNLGAASVIEGYGHFLLTPQPWNINEALSYLFLPTLLHWLMFVPALIGLYYLWRKSPITALYVIVWAIVPLFYAGVPEINGPRQRVQLTSMWAWAQFHFLYLQWKRFEVGARMSKSVRSQPGAAESPPSQGASRGNLQGELPGL